MLRIDYDLVTLMVPNYSTNTPRSFFLIHSSISVQDVVFWLGGSSLFLDGDLVYVCLKSLNDYALVLSSIAYEDFRFENEAIGIKHQLIPTQPDIP